MFQRCARVCKHLLDVVALQASLPPIYCLPSCDWFFVFRGCVPCVWSRHSRGHGRSCSRSQSRSRSRSSSVWTLCSARRDLKGRAKARGYLTERVNSPAEGVNSLAEGVNSLADGVNLPADGVNLPAEGVNSPAEGVNSPD